MLRHLVELARNTLRAADTVARFGGEEFIVLFPDTDEQVALAVVRRALIAIGNTPMVTLHGEPLHVTFSAGVATHGGYERFTTVQDLLKAADDVLYRSKSLGRNRVIARAPEPQPASG